MTAYTASPVCSTASNALIRAFAQFISDQLVAFGMVLTTDTGQTAANALTYSPTGNVAVGYQIFRFNDALQPTAPVFVKIEYGNGANFAAAPCVWITVGSSTDGAGNISSVNKSSRFQYDAYNGSGVANASYISGGPNGFRAAMFVGSQSYQYISIFGVERSKDASGADTADGIFVLGSHEGTTWLTQYVPFTGTVRASQANPVIPIPPSAMASLANGNSVGMVPILPFGQQGALNPASNFLVYYQPDTAALNALPVMYHGGYHTYIPLGACFTTFVIGWTSFSLAMLYE